MADPETKDFVCPNFMTLFIRIIEKFPVNMSDQYIHFIYFSEKRPKKMLMKATNQVHIKWFQKLNIYYRLLIQPMYMT